MKQILFFLGLAVLLTATQSNTITKTFTLKGIVLDKDTGSPLIGANVQVVGTNLGTVTDIDGKFQLELGQECASLAISYAGYTSQSVQKACAGKEIRVEMSAAQIMDEVVVIGYGQEKESTSAMRIFGKKDRAASMQAPMAAPAGGIFPYNYGDVQDNYNTEDYDAINENRFYEVNKEPLSTFSIDVDAASYSNMRRFLKNGQQPPKDAIRIEEMVNYFNYDYPEPEGEHPFEVITEISDCPWQPANKLLHIGLQGKHIPMENLPPSNLVFLIDVSGSMDQPNKLPLLQSSFKLLTDQLRKQDKVAIVVYAGAAGLVLEPTSGADKQKIKEAIGNLRAGGSTAGGAGIQLAYKTAQENFVKGGNNRVILATDGDFNVGASSDADMVRLVEKERESGVFLTVLGFGMGNYKDNKMQKLADAGNGNHAYIDDISEAKKVLVSEFGGTVFTIAKDVKLQIEFNPTRVRGYRLIGYENRVLANEDFNDDKKDAGELGSGHTVTALYEIIPTGVESAYLAKVDDLKYQENTVKPLASKSKELCTIKLRYKQPDGYTSKLLDHPVLDNGTKLDNSSDNFRWSAAVAEFGLLLRSSEYKGDATYAHAAKLARSAKGKDPNGYRREFIDMIDTMKSLADPDVAGKERD
ncbi:MAG: von Willebrand factor type A domain-containing protein [Lewinellaceae bacterium]|nr:von Willebrand factor type A domain-containing protein [Lewinellaceae bacterium]